MDDRIKKKQTVKLTAGCGHTYLAEIKVRILCFDCTIENRTAKMKSLKELAQHTPFTKAHHLLHVSASTLREYAKAKGIKFFHPNKRWRERNEAIFAALKTKEKKKDIAMRFGISYGRMRQIVEREQRIENRKRELHP